MKIDLIQPRHNLRFGIAGKGHTYLPNSILTAGARLLTSGIDIEIYDENIRTVSNTSDVVGINLLGAPYIPEAINLMKRIGEDKTYLLGGQVVSGLTPSQFQKLFGENAFNGNDDKTLCDILGLNEDDLPQPEVTSLIPSYELIPDEDMFKYLSREISLYVSQGCRESCSFCSAIRTKNNPFTGKTKKVAEIYREIKAIEEDLEYLVKRTKAFGLNGLDIYMSNLDVFQTPTKLNNFANAVRRVKEKYNGFKIRLRALSQVDSFLDVNKEFPEVIENMVEAGFHTIGFGVDGWNEKSWKKLRKGRNTKEKCRNAIRIARRVYDLTPEILMVFGHRDLDTEKDMMAAYGMIREMVEKYGALHHPYVSKPFIPGNDGWHSQENFKIIRKLIERPELFQALDFAAMASDITHQNEEQRKVINLYYALMFSIPGASTEPVIPIEISTSSVNKINIHKINEGKYDR